MPVLAREVSASDLGASFDMTFDAVSQHLRALRDAGLVSTWSRCRGGELATD